MYYNYNYNCNYKILITKICTIIIVSFLLQPQKITSWDKSTLRHRSLTMMYVTLLQLMYCTTQYFAAVWLIIFGAALLFEIWYHTVLYLGLLWYTALYFGLLWHTVLYMCLLWHTALYMGLLWHTVLYLGLLWHTALYMGLLWHTALYMGLLWHTVLYLGFVQTVFNFKIIKFSYSCTGIHFIRPF